jgi:N-acetylneuraminic acid mutarotase
MLCLQARKESSQRGTPVGTAGDQEEKGSGRSYRRDEFMTRMGGVLRGRGVGSVAVVAAGITVAVAMAPSAAAAPVRTVNTWTEVAPTPEGRFGSSVVAGTDGTVYAIGGLCPNILGFCLPVATVEGYSPRTNRWTQRAPMPTARQCLATTTGTDGRIYALGGEDQSGNSLTNAEVYSPTTDTWAVLPPLHDARGCLAAATDSQGNIYAIGGANGVTYASVERYSPTTNSWAYINTPMPQGLSELGATTGRDGRIYVIGVQAYVRRPDQLCGVRL